MADFTIELRTIVRNGLGGDLGLSDYPIFDEEHRPTLNKKIIDHFWYREIGHETIDIFVRQMRTRMHEIMPYYNKLYKSTLIKFDPMATTDIKVVASNKGTNSARTENDTSQTHSGNTESSSKNISDTDTKSRSVTSDMPQVRLSGDEDYATGAADSVSHAASTATATGTTTDTGQSRATQAGSTSGQSATDSQSRTVGYTGLPGDILESYRRAILNVDLMIIGDLEELFLGLWSSGNEIGEYGYGIPLF